MYARDIKYIDNHKALLKDHAAIEEVRANIAAGDTYIARNVYPRPLLEKIRNYLVMVGQSSLPNYHRIEQHAPNFHRMNRIDPRAHVQGCFHQFVFFPWNQDLFDMFTIFKEVYFMKNLLSNLRADSYLGIEPEDGCTARIAFQFYPQGHGRLNMHSDPVDYHQLTVPIMQLSEKGTDFDEGGLYVTRENGEKIIVDDVSGWGDIVYFNARVPHGVLPIDPHKTVDWHDFQGRWMLLFAVNRLFGNANIGDAIDLEKQS